MPTLQCEVENVDKVQAALKAVGVDLEDMPETNRAAAKIVYTASVGRVPRRSGALAASGVPSVEGKQAVVTYGSNSVRYANPIHWGWPARNIKAKPFLVDAMEATTPDVLSEYEAGTQRVIRKADLDG